jgi:integrase
MRLGLRARLARLLAHTHGLGPGVGDVDLRGGRLVARGLDDPAVRDLVLHYLRAAVETWGRGGGPVVDELVMAVALLNAALAFAAMRAGQAGRERDRWGQPRRRDCWRRWTSRMRSRKARTREVVVSLGGRSRRALDSWKQQKSIDAVSK